MNAPIKILSLSVVIALSGCANLEPLFSVPKAPVAGSIVNQSKEKAQPISLKAWQDFFPNENARTLIALALKNNRDLHIAAANVAEVEGLYQIQRQAKVPDISANGSGTTTRNSTNLSGNDNISRSYTASIGLASYELDFWGRVRNLSDAALANYFSTLEAQRASQLSVIASTANAYSDWLAAKGNLDLAKKTLESREKSYDLIKLRESVGIASTLDLAQAEVAKVTVEAQQAQAVRSLSAAKAALELLVGTSINEVVNAETIDPRLAFDFEIPENLDSNIILSRPDIIAAEEELRASNANIGAARAAFFPSITLMGSAGFASGDLNQLFSSDAKTWTFVPSISIPIFGNANRANLEVAKARQAKEVAQYEKAIQTAFSEIYVNLIARKARGVEIDANKRLVKAQQKRLTLAQARYDAGLSNYLEVLEAKENLFGAQQALLESERGEAESIIQLYSALGGGDSLQGSFRERAEK